MILLNLGDYVGVINVDEVKRARNIGWNKRFVAEDLLSAFWLTCETPVGSWKGQNGPLASILEIFDPKTLFAK